MISTSLPCKHTTHTDNITAHQKGDAVSLTNHNKKI